MFQQLRNLSKFYSHLQICWRRWEGSKTEQFWLGSDNLILELAVILFWVGFKFEDKLHLSACLFEDKDHISSY